MADSVYELLLKAKVDAADLPGLANSLRQVVAAEAATKKATEEMAQAMRDAAAARRRLEDVAAQGNAIEKLALDHRRLTAEIRELAKTEGNAALARTAQANANSQFVAALGGMRKATDETGETSKKASGNISGLVRQLNDVGVMAAMGASPMQILTTQGEQMVFAFKEAGGASGVLAGILGSALVMGAAIGGAEVAALYYTLQGYRDEAAQSEKQTAILNAGFEAMRPILDGTRDALIDLKEATGALTEAQADMERVAVRAFGTLQQATKDARAEIVKLHEAQSSVTTQVVDTIESAGRAVFGDSAPGVMIFDALTTNAKEYQGQIDAQNQTIREAQDATKALVATQQLAIQADNDSKSAKERETAAIKANREELKRAKEIRDEWTRGMKTWADAQRLVEDMAATTALEQETLRYERLTAALEAAAAAGADMATVLKAQSAAALEHAGILAKIRKEQDDANRSSVASTPAGPTGVERAGKVVSAGTSADATMGAISQAGPWGALVAAIVAALKEGLASIGDDFESYHEDVMKGLSTIFEDLGNNIYRWVSDGTEALVTGLSKMIRSLIGNLSNIIVGIVQAIIDTVFSANFFLGIFKAIILGFVDLFKSIFMPSEDTKKSAEDAKRNEIAWWNDLWTGKMTSKEFWSGDSTNDSKVPRHAGYASGTRMVSADGLYQLHKFEIVQNRAQANTSAAKAAAGGASARARLSGQAGRLVIEIDSDSVSDTLQDLARRGFALGGA